MSTTNKIKGTVLTARKAFVQKNFGSEAWDRVLAALPESDRRFHTGLVLAAGWYPFELGERLDKVIVDLLGKGNSAVFEAIGAQSAQENLAKVHRNFIVPGDPQAFLGKTSLIYGFYYSCGRREYEATGPTSGIMTTYDSDTFSEADCHTVIGWHKEALRICGARDVVIRHDVCRAKGGSFCRYSISWRI